MDSGASHHCTPYGENLDVKTGYAGINNLMVGNGKGLHIASVGNATLVNYNHNFYFKKLLHVPEIAKNLVSLQNFALIIMWLLNLVGVLVLLWTKQHPKCCIRGKLEVA